MKKKIAIIFQSDLNSQRGFFNAVRNRVMYLNKIADFDLDVYLLSSYEPWYIRLLRHTSKVEKVKNVQFDGINYKVYWIYFSLIDYILMSKLHAKPLIANIYYKIIINNLRHYDIISVHSDTFADHIRKFSIRNSIPYVVSWHGSDIHTIPFKSNYLFMQAKRVMESAACNFFVSKSLYETSKNITTDIKSLVLYNGINDHFHRYSDDYRLALRKEHNVPDNTKVIAFVGELIEVKNPSLLCPIFNKVRISYGKSLQFWIIGEGKHLNEVKSDCEDLNLPVFFWRGQPSEKMPSFMNCIDILVLPSRNEGLPLVTIEALSCGANVVGADVGGISEAIGKENVFPHGDSFVDNISNRIVYMLNNHVEQKVGEVFNWSATAEKELSVYEIILNGKQI